MVVGVGAQSEISGVKVFSCPELEHSQELKTPDHVHWTRDLESARKILKDPNINAVLVPSKIDFARISPALRGFIENADIEPEKLRNCSLERLGAHIDRLVPTSAFDERGLSDRATWIREMLDLSILALEYTGRGKLIDATFGTNSLGFFASDWHLDRDLLVVGVDYHSAGMQYVANSNVRYDSSKTVSGIEVLGGPIHKVPPRVISISKGTSLEKSQSSLEIPGLVHRRPPHDDADYPYTHRLILLVGAEI